MKVFVDTNIIIDVVLNRKPFVDHSRLILDAGWANRISLFTSSVSFVNVHYIVEKFTSKEKAMASTIHLNELFEVLNVDQTMIDQSIRIEPYDFEDAVQYFAAKSANCGCIISRDKKGFKQFDLPCMTPKEFLDAYFSS
ncbi:MAG: PIN domain-containing protein [Salibacteraceae bacterium]|nr:PIN domain-containing protein [Salibacteraceae bacterium]